MTNEYIHINQAVRTYDKTRQTFYNYIKKGYIESKKVNNKLFLKIEDIEKMLTDYISPEEVIEGVPPSTPSDTSSSSQVTWVVSTHSPTSPSHESPEMISPHHSTQSKHTSSISGLDAQNEILTQIWSRMEGINTDLSSRIIQSEERLIESQEHTGRVSVSQVEQAVADHKSTTSAHMTQVDHALKKMQRRQKKLLFWMWFLVIIGITILWVWWMW